MITIRSPRFLKGAAVAMAALALAVAGAVAPATTPDAAAQSPGGSGLLALTAGNKLLRFSPARPGTIQSTVTISGLVPGESILGIDYRPANGMLYGLGSTSRLYTISPATGAATGVGSGFTPPLMGTEFGFDFNPVPDRIRVVSNTGQDLRLHPDTGAVAGVDGMLRYAPGDPNNGTTPRVVGAAYTNSFAGSTQTTNYVIDANLDVLATQGSVNGSPVSPNTGQLFTVGSLGLNISNVAGFDITPNNVAYAVFTQTSTDLAARIPGAVTLRELGATTSNLYTINLATGAASFIGVVGSDEVIRGLTVIP